MSIMIIITGFLGLVLCGIYTSQLGIAGICLFMAIFAYYGDKRLTRIQLATYKDPTLARKPAGTFELLNTQQCECTCCFSEFNSRSGKSKPE